MIKGVASIKNTILGDVPFDLSQLSDFLDKFGGTLLILALVLVVVFIFVFCMLVKFAYHLCDIFFSTVYNIFHDWFSKSNRSHSSENDESLTEEDKGNSTFQYFIENADEILGKPSNPVKRFILHLSLKLLKIIFKRGDSPSISEKEDEQ